MRDKADKPDGMSELHISVVGSIGEVSAAEWDACANPPVDSSGQISVVDGTAPRFCETNIGTANKAEILDYIFDYNPFLSHAFLASLEQSHSVGPRTGWQPQ